MGVWSTILKYGGKAAKGTGKAVLATGKNVGEAALHPSQTLRGAGQAVKTAAVGGAIGYVGWEKLTTDKMFAFSPHCETEPVAAVQQRRTHDMYVKPMLPMIICVCLQVQNI